jgi:MFS family permease
MTRLERHGWVIVGVLSIALFLLMGTAYDIFGIFLVPLQEHFGWNSAQSSLPFTAMGLLYAASMPAAGWLLDRFDARFVMAAGTGVCGVGFLCASVSNSYASIMAAYILIGIGIGVAGYVPITVVITNWFQERRGLAMGIALSGEFLGIMVMAPVLTRTISTWSWRAGYLTIAVLMLVLLLPLALALVRTRPGEAHTLEHGHISTDDLPGMEVKEALRSRSFWMVAIAQICWGCAITGLFMHLPAYMDGLGYRPGAAALAMSVYAALGIVGQPLAGGITDRLGARTSLIVTFSLLAAGSMCLAWAQHVGFLSMYVGTGLIANSPVLMTSMLVADSLGRKRYGSLQGLLGSAAQFGAAFGPELSGLMFDATNSYVRAFQLLALLQAVGAIAAFACIPGEYTLSETAPPIAEREQSGSSGGL